MSDDGQVSDDGRVRDPGLAPERTRFAWGRTLLSQSVAAILCLRLAVGAADGIRLFGTTAAALLWLGSVAVTGYRARALPAPSVLAARPALPLSAIIAIGYAVLGVILVLTNQHQ